LTELTPRVRDLRLGSAGFIDLLTDEPAGALLRMESLTRGQNCHTVT
jgi:hypothetical protein